MVAETIFDMATVLFILVQGVDSVTTICSHGSELTSQSGEFSTIADEKEPKQCIQNAPEV